MSMRIVPLRDVVTVVSLILCVGCQSSIAPKQGAGGQSSHVGGQANAGANAQNGGAGAGQSAVLPSEALTLTGVEARVDGRRGSRVRMNISGTQQPGALASVAVTALDSSGTPLYWYSTKHDGRFDSATGYLVPVSLPGESEFRVELVVPLTNALLNWSQARVSLFDRVDAASNELLVNVAAQPVKAKGDSCDPTSELDRCASELECSAGSRTCVDHTGPALTKAGYWTTEDGALLVATGVDNADDLKQVDLAFLDANGSPVQVNLNNDTTHPLMASSFTETAGISSNDGQIGFRINPSQAFAELVKAVNLVPVDVAGRRGDAISATLQSQPSRGSGMACDVHGFDFCSGNSACLPGVAGMDNSCQPITSAQSAACAAASVLDVSQKQRIVTGYNIGSSLWEPPAGCVGSIGLHHPETVIKLHVPLAVDRLTLSTDRRETLVDTVLYVVSGCGTASPSVLGCNDDFASGSPASAVNLTNVAAGDYYVIVDSIANDGGPFGLELAAE